MPPITMSRHASRERISTVLDSVEALAVIREEQVTPTDSNPEVQDGSKNSAKGADNTSNISFANKTEECPADCACQDKGGVKFGPEEVQKMLNEKEATLKAEFSKQLERELNSMKESFDYILQNEQVRSTFMLREAHRERQEKVTALQTQLECKNMAALMYVMCSERRKSKLEKLRIIEEYSNYIHALQDILSEGQSLILHLSRGYKTAARVDHEWREKLKKVIKEFQEYVYHFAGGSPDTNQYVFDIPALLKTEAAIIDNPREDPCDIPDEEQEIEQESEKNWWDQLETECRPFVVLGDMAEFTPPQRRAVLKTVKAAKTAPPKWKDYVFHEMFLNADCSNLDTIKDEYPKYIPPEKWECPHAAKESSYHDIRARESGSRRHTQSVDMRTAMGSILRIITSSCVAHQQSTVKANLLGARDSMEIASTTRLREKHRESVHTGSKSVSISLALNKSNHRGLECDDNDFDSDYPNAAETRTKMEQDAEDAVISTTGLGSIHQDSLQVIPGHVPDEDHKINYEKICPMEKCQRMQVDSFMRTLPAYMRESPFANFQQTFENYDTCSPEQLAILKKRIEDKRKMPSHDEDEHPLDEWTPSVDGIAVQTSELSVSLPPCLCRVPSPTPATSVGRVYNVEDLIPMKEALDEINRECFYDDRIQFDRFKVIGQGSSQTLLRDDKSQAQDFKQTRMVEIKKILKRHPSLLDLFQGNTQC